MVAVPGDIANTGWSVKSCGLEGIIHEHAADHQNSFSGILGYLQSYQWHRSYYQREHILKNLIEISRCRKITGAVLEGLIRMVRLAELQFPYFRLQVLMSSWYRAIPYHRMITYTMIKPPFCCQPLTQSSSTLCGSCMSDQILNTQHYELGRAVVYRANS